MSILSSAYDFFRVVPKGRLVDNLTKLASGAKKTKSLDSLISRAYRGYYGNQAIDKTASFLTKNVLGGKNIRSAVLYGTISAGTLYNASQRDKQLKGYYGDDEYESRFSSASSAFKVASATLGVYGATTALLGVGPITQAVKGVKGLSKLALSPAQMIVRPAAIAADAAMAVRRGKVNYGAVAFSAAYRDLTRPLTATAKVLSSGMGKFGLAAAASYGTGAMLGSVYHRHGASEGNITELSTDKVTSRMDFNTAGLVQALHRNRIER